MKIVLHNFMGPPNNPSVNSEGYRARCVGWAPEGPGPGALECQTMDPSDSKEPEWVIFCPCHGVLETGVKDWIAANLVAERHRERPVPCSAEVSIYRQSNTEFAPASELGPSVAGEYGK